MAGEYLSMARIMGPSIQVRLERMMVTRVRGRPIEDLDHFDWMSEFQIGGQAVLRPQALGGNQLVRARMVSMLRSARLGVQIIRQLVAPTVRTRNEHDAYIVEGGTLIDVQEGHGYGVDHHDPSAGSRPVGYIHTHPASSQIRPPTIGRDWLGTEPPVQLMVESGPRRAWGLVPPNFACVLGLLDPTGSFSELDPAAPQAGIIYAMSSG